jgi:hypothetical protein
VLEVLDNQLAANAFAEYAVVEVTASKTNNAIIDRRVLVFFVGRGMVVDFDELIILFETPVSLFFRDFFTNSGAVLRGQYTVRTF